MPVLTPRFRLPAFQWKDDADGAATVSKIEGMDKNGNYLQVSSGFLTWTNDPADGFATFLTSGLNITSAIAAGASLGYTTQSISFVTGDVITIKGIYVKTSGASNARILIYKSDFTAIYQTTVLTPGENIITYTLPSDQTLKIVIDSNVVINCSFTGVSITINKMNGLFPSLPASHALAADVYFQYKGTTLNYLLPRGVFYMKITMNNSCIYYSDWFVVTDIYPNLILNPKGTSTTYDTFDVSGTEITSAINAAAGAYSYSDVFSNVVKGEIITLYTYLTLNSGELPSIILEGDTGGLNTLSATTQLAAGLNVINITVTKSSTTAYLRIINTAASNFITSEILLIRAYSPNFLKLVFNDTHDLGDILYHDSFIQTCFLETKLHTPTHEVEEVGEEKNGIWIAEKIVTKYKYRIIANVGRELYKALLRLPQHDTITITDEVGNTYSPKPGNIWVSPANWIYYDICRLEIQFNDNTEFIWTSENNNIP
jgi:hypothetical protein